MRIRSSTGFTLIEVLVALIILGISLGTIFQALSSSRRISLKADETFQAVRIAENILADPALIDLAINGKGAAAPVSGENGWRFTLSSLPLEIGSGNQRNLSQIPAMYELTLCVFHETDFREKSFCTKKWIRKQ